MTTTTNAPAANDTANAPAPATAPALAPAPATPVNTTVSYTARPADHRCRWWSVRIPAGYCRAIDLENESSLRPLGFLKKGADLELDDGEMVIDSEANHHAKARGYTVQLLVIAGGEMYSRTPSAVTKNLIKTHATPEQWERLRRGSGDVAACLRLAMAIELFSPQQLRNVWSAVANAKYGPEAQPEAQPQPEALTEPLTDDAGPTPADLQGTVDHDATVADAPAPVAEAPSSPASEPGPQ